MFKTVCVYVIRVNSKLSEADKRCKRRLVGHAERRSLPGSLLTNAHQRWDISGTHQIPSCVQPSWSPSVHSRTASHIVLVVISTTCPCPRLGCPLLAITTVCANGSNIRLLIDHRTSGVELNHHVTCQPGHQPAYVPTHWPPWWQKLKTNLQIIINNNYWLNTKTYYSWI